MAGSRGTGSDTGPGLGTGALSMWVEKLWGPNTLNRPLQKAKALEVLPSPCKGG